VAGKNMVNDKCPICLEPSLQVNRLPNGRDAYEIKCPKCGDYLITGPAAASDLSKYGPRYLLSAIVRNRFELNENIELSVLAFEHLIDSVPKFDDPFSKIDLLLKHVYRLSGRVDRWAEFKFNQDYPLIYAEDQQEFFYFIQKAKEMDLLESPTSSGLRLTLNGWARLKELSKISIKSDQAFVAMWFDSSLDSAWLNGFKPALLSCNFLPMRIDLEEHNDKICDRIISEIRRSGLIIADFTGQRGGVYFESGFAMGLGIPIIRTCRKDYVETLHFDTRQYNHVIWESSEELKEKLINRIRATLPKITTAT
jgi:hypothetical protein